MMLIEGIDKCDAIEFRATIASLEASDCMNFIPGETKLKGDKSESANQKLGVKKLVKDLGQDKVVARMARESKKFDFFTGIARTYDIYGYLGEKDLWNRFNNTDIIDNRENKDFIIYRRLLYSKLMHMSEQFYDSNVEYTKNAVDSERSIEDKEGKSSNVMGTYSVAEVRKSLVPDSDSDVITNFKIYLEFLYNVATSLKANESTPYSKVIPETLGYLWIKDTLNYYENPSGNYYKYFDIYDGPDKINMVPSIDRVNSVFLKSLTKKNIPDAVLDAVMKTHLQYKTELGDSKVSLGSDEFLFSRYIYKILTLNKIDIFKSYNKMYEGIANRNITESDMYDLMLSQDNIYSLINQIPTYKFEPSFYRKVRSLKDWFHLSKEDLEDEYGLNEYRGFDVAEPVKQIMTNTIGGGVSLNIGQVGDNGYGEISDQEKLKELKEILILEHMHKMQGVTRNPNRLYKTILESKKERIFRLEGPLSISSIATRVDRNRMWVSMMYKESKKEDKEKSRSLDIHPMYNILGLKGSPMVKLKNLTNRTPTDQTWKVINKIIKDRLTKQAEIYKKHYEDNDWNIPYRYVSTKELTDVIKSTMISDIDTQQMMFLGDSLELPVKIYLRGYEDQANTGRCTMRIDGNVIYKEGIYTPEIDFNESDNSPFLFIRVDGTEQD